MENTICRIGAWSAWLACTATIAYVIVQLLQIAGLLHFPFDEILIYGTSLCIVLPFIISVLALHHLTTGYKRFYSQGALIFAILYAVFVTANYVVQLATVIPAKLRHQVDTVAVLDQAPHSMFWNFDALGYIFMGAVTLMAMPVFAKEGFGLKIRRVFLAHTLVTLLIALVYFYPVYSPQLLMLGFPWGITAPLAMGSLAVWFSKNREETQSATQAAIKRTSKMAGATPTYYEG